VADNLRPFLGQEARDYQETFSSGVIVPIEGIGGLFPKIYKHTKILVLRKLALAEKK